MNYGKAIKTIRAAKNLEQKELARLAELNASYISLIESNRRAPSPAVLEAIAKALSVPLYLLMLLGSDKDDLHGVSEKEATLLGKQLLDVVLQAQQPKERATRSARAKR
jgi:transcriptional regulator with XRE-family HTH domain